jgi:hypothetical protein
VRGFLQCLHASVRIMLHLLTIHYRLPISTDAMPLKLRR